MKAAAKALLFAIVAAAFGFFLGTFLGIASLFILGVIRGATPNFAIAYQFGGLPLAAFGFLAGAVFSLARDFRLRKNKPL